MNCKAFRRALAAALAVCCWGPAAEARGLNAIYVCQDAQGTRYALQLTPDGRLAAGDGQSPPQEQGTYSFFNQQIRLTLPTLSFDQVSTQLVQEKGLILAFETPSLFCGLMGHDRGPAIEGYAQCPTIKYVPSVGWQKNAFEFYSNHSVKWRQWDEYVAFSDTTYSESYGIYLIEGNVLSMVFPFREKEDVLTGTINQDYTFLINELEPQSGPCTPNG